MQQEKKQLSEIFCYPIKSLGGISLRKAKIEERGLQYDRRWMLVDAASGLALTQRTVPKMALLQVALKETALQITQAHQKLAPLLIPFQKTEGFETIQVQVWGSICTAQTIDKQIDEWFSEALEQPCRLVYMPDNCQRLVDVDWAKKGEIVSFADGYPLLLIGQSALDDLNKRMEKAILVNRFRPNLVFTGGSPYEGDTWHRFRIGQTIFENVKPCSRCIVTTLDQATLARGKEPLKTLATYRKVGGKVMFGHNLLIENATQLMDENSVAVGQEIEVLSWKEGVF